MIHDADTDQTTAEAARALLDWYAAMGVTAIVSDQAAGWLSRGDDPPMRAADLIGSLTPSNEPARSSSAVAQTPTVREAGTRPAFPPPDPPARQPRHTRSADGPGKVAHEQTLARSAHDLAALRDLLEQFDGCALKATAKNICFYRGAEQAEVMVIGEGPGREEDLSGLPFVGRAGKLLDKMLHAIGRSEADTHITNVVYWRPPGNRTPTAAEVLACRPFLERQAELVDPRIIIAVGGAAAKSLLDSSSGIMKLRGRWQTIELGGKSRPIMATLHPAYLLRTPAAKRMAWRDLLAIEERLREGD